MRLMYGALVLLSLCAAYATDVPVVENEEVPTGRMTLKFEEDLRIGPDSDEDYLIWSGSLVTPEVDSRGHIFITDGGGNRILEFDTEGNFVRQIGGPGQGPGEFRQLYAFRILADDTAVAFDNDQNVVSFTYFDKNKNYVSRTPNLASSSFIQSAFINRTGTHYTAFWMTFNDQKVYSGILDKDFKPNITLTTDNRVLFDNAQAGSPKWWEGFLADWIQVPMRGAGIAAFGWDGTSFTAVNTKYEITRYDADMKPDLIIRRKYKPRFRSEEHIMGVVDPLYNEIASLVNGLDFLTPALVKRAVEKAELSPAKMPIYAMFALEDGGLVVIHDWDGVSNRSTADIFDKNGVYVGVAELPRLNVNVFGGLFGARTHMVFRHGKAYAMIPDEDDELYMVRYKVSLIEDPMPPGARYSDTTKQ